MEKNTSGLSRGRFWVSAIHTMVKGVSTGAGAAVGAGVKAGEEVGAGMAGAVALGAWVGAGVEAGAAVAVGAALMGGALVSGAAAAPSRALWQPPSRHRSRRMGRSFFTKRDLAVR